LSSNENFLIFGANCSENCLPVQQYSKLLLNDITKEKETFTVNVNIMVKLFMLSIKLVNFPMI